MMGRFAKSHATIQAAAQDGILHAGKMLAEALRQDGENASAVRAPDGTVSVVVESATAILREFGTRRWPAAAFLGPLLQARRRVIASMVARAIGEAL
ncbi:MAG: hypothetical protein IID54_03805, partial [Proteobacteria bacterium]|nr:hypothetical protein [Pseudomonadota bacterium]